MIGVWLILVGLATAAEPVDAPLSTDAASSYQALRELPPDEREAVVQRLLDEGLLPAMSSRAAAGADRRALASTVEQRLAEGRAHLLGARPDEALVVLEPVRDDPRVAPFWQEAVDEHVYAERELAGRWFQRAQRTSGAERRLALSRARQILVRAATTYPESVYAEPVLVALGRVERTIDATARSTVASGE